jgi:hypothetical protein
MVHVWLTIPQAAKEFGVTNQRMHQLLKTYSVKTICLASRVKLVTRRELKKIPAHRPPGPMKNRKS